jgi:hypothetical protein
VSYVDERGYCAGGSNPQAKLVYTKLLCCKIVVNAVSVCENPLTKSLARLPGLFVVNEILIARLLVFPLRCRGGAVLGCISLFFCVFCDAVFDDETLGGCLFTLKYECAYGGSSFISFALTSL